MELNGIWDVSFASGIAWAGLSYFSRKPARHGISKARQLLFATALLLLALILVGPLPHLAIRNFTFHMVQHILLMMLIAPLIVLGSPFKLFRIDRGPFRYLLKAEVGFGIFLAVLIATHFSPLANAGMRNPNIHSIELILFIVGGVIYYYPVMEGNPHPFPVPYSVRVLSLFAMMLPETMTGFFLYSGNRLVHSLPDSVTMKMGLHQQHSGGAIMWGMGMLIDTMWIVIAARDWFVNEAKLAEEEDE
jgi:putative copper resistance protein D